MNLDRVSNALRSMPPAQATAILSGGLYERLWRRPVGSLAARVRLKYWGASVGSNLVVRGRLRLHVEGQLTIGDRVRLSYRIGLALALVKGGDGIREKVETDSAAVAARGAKPGGTVMKRTTIVANVESVDAKRGVATLRGPSGDFVDVKVRDPKILHEVKAGDQVVASFTESVALRVQPAPAK